MSSRAPTTKLFALLVIVASAFGVAKLRPGLAERFHKLKATSDVYALPAPEQVVVLSLGYRAALADLLWGNVLVSYGLHFQEKRRFEFIGNYLDTINALDPKFEDPYRFADTLLTLQPVPPLREDYYKAREILRRGMKELPHSAVLHSTAGQFLAYLVPTHLETQAEKQEWRLEGAQALSRACELSDASSNIPYHCIVAAGLLNRAGQREAVIQMLQRTLAVNDDENIRAMALGYLEREVSQRAHEEQQRRINTFNRAWKEDLGFLDKDTMLIVGPRSDTAACSGLAAAHQKECVDSWRTWAERTFPKAVDGS